MAVHSGNVKKSFSPEKNSLSFQHERNEDYLACWNEKEEIGLVTFRICNFLLIINIVFLVYGYFD